MWVNMLWVEAPENSKINPRTNLDVIGSQKLAFFRAFVAKVNDLRRTAEEDGGGPPSFRGCRVNRRTTNTRTCRNTEGLYPVIVTFGAALAFTLMSLCIKLGGARLPSLELAWFRSIVQCMITMTGTCYIKQPILGQRRDLKPLLIRAFICWVGQICYFYAVTQLPLSEVTPLTFTGPIWTSILAIIILKESWHVLDMIGSFISLCGVILIAHPPFLFPSVKLSPEEEEKSELDVMHLVAVGVVLFGAVNSSLAGVLTRKMGVGVHFFIQVTWFSIVGIVLCPIGFYWDGFVVPTGWDCLIILLLGISGCAGQSLLQLALQIERAARVATLGYIQIVFVLLLDMLFLHNIPDLWSIIGTLMICFYALIATLKESKHVTEFFSRCGRKRGVAYDKVETSEAEEEQKL
ncbi:transmembrane protein [Planoprotostelium fungivorum]|uniref:Transmembrane protein n=1 Tax=Planoprotostelium fungivorum TaxID=1890364 RepID=A0A2P6NPV1_9EUKA|nr:transmembrane protein [Planoprotostelium fungivorum]